MEKSALEKLWTAIHLAAVYAGVNAILFLQNSPMALPLNFVMRDGAGRGRHSMAIFWCFIAGVLLACSLLSALSYVKHHGGRKRGVVAAPVMFSMTLRAGSNMARAYQGFWLVLCMALAAYGVAHSARTVLRAPLYECDARAVAQSAQTFRAGRSIAQGLWPRFGGVDVRFDGCGPSAPTDSRSDKRGVEYVPIVNDMLIGGVALLDIWLVFLFWWRWRRAAT